MHDSKDGRVWGAGVYFKNRSVIQNRLVMASMITMTTMTLPAMGLMARPTPSPKPKIPMAIRNWATCRIEM